MTARCVCLQYINDAATGSGDHSETDDVSDAVEQSVTRPSSTEPTSKVHPQSIIHSNSYTITMCRTTYVRTYVYSSLIGPVHHSLVSMYKFTTISHCSYTNILVTPFTFVTPPSTHTHLTAHTVDQSSLDARVVWQLPAV